MGGVQLSRPAGSPCSEWMPGPLAASTSPDTACQHLKRHRQDFLNRVNLDTEGMARGVPPSVRMLCLHGTADKTIPWQVRASGQGAWPPTCRLCCQACA